MKMKQIQLIPSTAHLFLFLLMWRDNPRAPWTFHVLSLLFVIIYIVSDVLAALDLYKFDSITKAMKLSGDWCDPSVDWCNMSKNDLIQALRKYAKIHPYYNYYQSSNLSSFFFDNFMSVDVDNKLANANNALLDYFQTHFAISKAFAACGDPNFMYSSPLEKNILSSFNNESGHAYFVLPFTLFEGANGDFFLEPNNLLDSYKGLYTNTELVAGERYTVNTINNTLPSNFVLDAYPYSKMKINGIAHSMKYYRGGTIIPISEARNNDDVCIDMMHNGTGMHKCFKWAVLLSDEDVMTTSYGFEHQSQAIEREILYQYNGKTVECIVYNDATDTVNFPLAYTKLKFNGNQEMGTFPQEMETCKSNWTNIKKYLYDTRDLSVVNMQPNYYDAIYAVVVISDFSVSPSTDLFSFHFEDYAKDDDINALERDKARYSSVKIASFFVDPLTRARKSIDPFATNQQIYTWKNSMFSPSNSLLSSHFSRVERFPTPTVDEWVEFRGTQLNFISEYNRARSGNKKRGEITNGNVAPSYENTMVLVDGTCAKDCAFMVSRLMGKGYAKVISTFPNLFREGFNRPAVNNGGGSVSSTLSQISSDKPDLFKLMKFADLTVGHYIVHTNTLPDTVGVQLSSSSQYGGEMLYLPVEGEYPCTDDCVEAAIKAFAELKMISFADCQTMTDEDKDGIRYAKYTAESLEGSELPKECVKFDCPSGYGFLDGKCVLSTLTVVNQGSSIVILAVAILGSLLAGAVGFGLLTKCLIDKKKVKGTESKKLMA